MKRLSPDSGPNGGLPTISDASGGEVDGGRAALIDHIRGQLPGLPAKQRRVAKALLDDPYLVGYTAASEIASHLAVDPATVVRAAQSLGFEGWRDLQSLVRSQLRQGSMFRDRIGSIAQVEDAEVLNAMRELSIDSVNGAFGEERYAAIIETADAITGADAVFVLGGGITAGIADLAASTLRLLGKTTHLVIDAEAAAILLPQLRANDVMITFAVRRYLRWLVAANEVAAGLNAYTVGVTDTEASPVALRSNVSVVTPCIPVGPRLNTIAMSGVAHAISALVAGKIDQEQTVSVTLSERFTNALDLIHHE